METIIQSTPLNNVEIELANAKNYIQELEKKIKLLEIDIAEKNSKILGIKDNLEMKEVENWRVEDDYGVGYFEGQIWWTFAYGGIHYEDKTSLEAVWDLTGEIRESEYYDSNNKLIEKWEDGKLVEISDAEDSDEEDSDAEDSEEEDSEEEDSDEEDSEEEDSDAEGSNEEDSSEEDFSEEDSNEKDSNEKDSNEKDRVRNFLKSMYITHKDSDVRIYPKINF